MTPRRDSRVCFLRRPAPSYEALTSFFSFGPPCALLGEKLPSALLLPSFQTSDKIEAFRLIRAPAFPTCLGAALSCPFVLCTIKHEDQHLSTSPPPPHPENFLFIILPFCCSRYFRVALFSLHRLAGRCVTSCYSAALRFFEHKLFPASGVVSLFQIVVLSAADLLLKDLQPSTPFS